MGYTTQLLMALVFVVVVFVFNVPPTAKVIWRRGHGLKSHPTDWRSRESNLRPLVYKASGLSTTPRRLLALVYKTGIKLMMRQSSSTLVKYVNYLIVIYTSILMKIVEEKICKKEKQGKKGVVNSYLRILLPTSSTFKWLNLYIHGYQWNIGYNRLISEKNKWVCFLITNIAAARCPNYQTPLLIDA